MVCREITTLIVRITQTHIVTLHRQTILTCNVNVIVETESQLLHDSDR